MVVEFEGLHASRGDAALKRKDEHIEEPNDVRSPNDVLVSSSWNVSHVGYLTP